MRISWLGSLQLVVVAGVVVAVVVGCGDPAPVAAPADSNAPAAAAAVDDATPEPKPESGPVALGPTAEPEPSARVATQAPGAVVVEVDGVSQRFEVREAGHATINRMSNPPGIAVFARGPAGEQLMLKLGGLDLERVTFPLELRDLDVGGAVVSFTYVDAKGVRHTARVDQSTPDTWATLDTWSSAEARLVGRFSARVHTATASHMLTGGSFDVVLHDPFGAR